MPGTTSSVSGLAAVREQFSTATNNISNNSVTAFKGSERKFLNVMGGPTGGGVRTILVSRISEQGAIRSTQRGTDMAVNGQGFFVVSSGSKDGNLETFYFQRAGETVQDAQGYARTTSGHFRRAWPVGDDAKISVSDKTSLTQLVPMNFKNITGTVKPTTYMTMALNLDSRVAAAAVETTTAQAVDSLGNAHTLNFSWTKTANNAWTLGITSDGATIKVTNNAGANYTAVPLTFDGNGLPLTFNGSGAAGATMPDLYVDWGNGSTASTVTLNLGTIGQSNGISQVSQPTNMSRYDQDGQIFGVNTGVTIDKTGLVTARFSNGTSKPIYRIPLATFPNADGLEVQTGGVYASTNASGAFILQEALSGAAGSIESNSLEDSNTDIPSELIVLVEAESAFFANAKGIEINGKLMEDLKRI